MEPSRERKDSKLELLNYKAISIVIGDITSNESEWIEFWTKLDSNSVIETETIAENKKKIKSK